ncbi:hypothetical protein [Streptomyces murinus]|uniref:Rv1733c family protein n=1 Tax=Streptomyces murinus TaxID=33900 RepID=UPI002E1611A3|nr:hypothetical protein OG516_05390 [Streptomyces murinus]
MAFRGPKVWLWRWRRNPLKRRADVVEGWVVLGVGLLTVLAGVLAGLMVARSVTQGLARERADWRPTVAHVVAAVPDAHAGRRHISHDARGWAEVRWTVADGSVHTGRVRVAAGDRVGTGVTVWTDSHGHLVGSPVPPGQAAFRADLVGTLAGLGTALVPFAAGFLLRARLERRRMTAWDTEWARLGPQWGRMV